MQKHDRMVPVDDAVHAWLPLNGRMQTGPSASDMQQPGTYKGRPVSMRVALLGLLGGKDSFVSLCMLTGKDSFDSLCMLTHLKVELNAPGWYRVVNGPDTL